MQENEDYCLESSQQSEDPQYQDIGHMYSLDSFGDVYHFSRFAHIFVLLSPFVLTFGMRGLYNELKWHDFTLGRLENSSVHEDPKIYANNCLLIRMGPEFSSDIAGDGPEYCDTEVSDNYSSVEDSESPSTGESDSPYDPDKDMKLAQKKRKDRFILKRRRELGPEARRKNLEARNKKRKEMGPVARRKDLEAQKKKRKEMGPKARRTSSVEDSDSPSTGESDSPYDPDKDKKLAQKKGKDRFILKRRRELGPEARRKNLEARN